MYAQIYVVGVSEYVMESTVSRCQEQIGRDKNSSDKISWLLGGTIYNLESQFGHCTQHEEQYLPTATTAIEL